MVGPWWLGVNLPEDAGVADLLPAEASNEEEEAIGAACWGGSGGTSGIADPCWRNADPGRAGCCLLPWDAESEEVPNAEGPRDRLGVRADVDGVDGAVGGAPRDLRGVGMPMDSLDRAAGFGVVAVLVGLGGVNEDVEDLAARDWRRAVPVPALLLADGRTGVVAASLDKGRGGPALSCALAVAETLLSGKKRPSPFSHAKYEVVPTEPSFLPLPRSSPWSSTPTKMADAGLPMTGPK